MPGCEISSATGRIESFMSFICFLIPIAGLPSGTASVAERSAEYGPGRVPEQPVRGHLAEAFTWSRRGAPAGGPTYT